MSVNTEIERKFLIKLPSSSFLLSLPHTEIVQTYLKNDQKGVTERVRKRGLDGQYVYTHTKKTRIDPMSSIEDESEITQEEYLRLLSRADLDKTPVHKMRCLIKKGDFTFEIDVYPFWKKQAVMEVELPNEQAEFVFPDDICVLREVTGDHAYSNARIAKCIPQED
ncbi:MAG: hypothetical protein IKJ65_04730 [Clostridia bacterium]|nr:hypothetical protein [Clostridia bacterium]